jgi:excisionase family DNA binding protein
LTRGLSGLIYARDTGSLPDSEGGRRKFPKRKPAGRRHGAGKRVLWRGKETGSEKMADSREVMNIRQASDYLGVSPDTLYKYVGEEKIPAFKLGNRWRFKKSRLDQWMEEKSSQLEPGARQKAKAATRAAGSQ